MKRRIRESLFRIWYWYVSKADKHADVIFMNYGYSDNGEQIPLDSDNEKNRYSIQLYNHLATETDITGKDIAEIGCGRGGGLSYIFKEFKPKSAKGVDLNKLAISFCQRYYNLEGLSFQQGDAQNLTLEDNSCDIIFNVESSHRYPNMKAFLMEVKRILRPGGYFLFTDFRFDYGVEEMKEDLNNCGLSILKQREINKEVISALDLDDDRRRKLVKKLVPKFLHKVALNFAGAIGSETYERFVSRKYVYFSYVLKK
ncbi:MAG: class I SAM-dependent methyltransferase [Bacteroidetes bacterium]|nr:class I SAM-dependent methyltransferase [Bacteroidota bacterium]